MLLNITCAVLAQSTPSGKFRIALVKQGVLFFPDYLYTFA